MSIKFPCPRCKKSLKVKDELAGKKAKCPACQQVITIPKPKAPVANIEELVAAALTEKAPEPVAATEPKTVEFTCFYCDAALKLDVTLCGKQTPCPECKHIIKVPRLVKNEPKDWRTVDNSGPSGAKRDTGPAPEGAWGSTTSAGTVSKQALLDAGAIPTKRQPRSVGRMVLLAGGLVALLGFLVYGGWYGWSWWVQRGQDQLLARAFQGVSGDSTKPKLSAPEDAEICRAAGEYYLRTRKPGCANKADENFNRARAFLLPIPRPEAKLSYGLYERNVSLINLALAQIELGGSEEEVTKGLRKPWDHAQTMVYQTLDKMTDAEALRAGFRAVTRAFIAHGQSGRAANLVRQLRKDPENLAVVGLELLRANDPKAAEGVAREALLLYAAGAKPAGDTPPPPPEKPAAGKPPPFGPSLKALCMLLKLELPAALAAQVKEESRPSLDFTIALASAGQAGGNDPGALADLIEKEPSAPPWLVFQVVRLAISAGLPADRIDRLSIRIADNDLRGRAKLELLQARLNGLQGQAAEEALKDVDEKSPTQSLAHEAIARHNARLDKSTSKSVDGWNERFRPFGYIGVLLGMQDARR